MNETLPSNDAQVARRYVVDILLTVAQLEAFYAGNVTQVSAIDRHGRRLQFPLSSLRPYVTHAGVRGAFELAVDRSNRLLALRRCA